MARVELVTKGHVEGATCSSRAKHYRKGLPCPPSLFTPYPLSFAHHALFSHSPPPFEDSGFSCYSNRAASPASEPHWRHVHCRIHLRLSWRLPG